MLSVGSIACKNNSTGSGDGGTIIRNFQMTMRSSGNITNLVRSQISSNNNNKAGTNNSQDLKVFFEANGSYTTVVQAIYLETNYSGGSYDPSTGVITLTDITNWTNSQGAPLFDTNPSNFTVKITATASGFDTGSPKEFTIPATLQFANIISNVTGNMSVSNALFNPNGKSSFGDNGFYSNSSTGKNADIMLKFDSSSGFSNYIFIKNSQNNYSGDFVLSGAELREVILTNGSYTNYFSDLSVSFLTNGKFSSSLQDNDSAYYSIVFTPYYSNEMETNANLLILNGFTNKVD